MFRRGNDVYDWANVGFDSTTVSEGGHEYFEFDTRLRGNSNAGHKYGTDLSDTDRDAAARIPQDALTPSWVDW